MLVFLLPVIKIVFPVIKPFQQISAFWRREGSFVLAVSHSVMKDERIIPPKSTALTSAWKDADEVGVDEETNHT